MLAACDLPFGLGQPSTRALESGAARSLDGSFEMTGAYSEQGAAWTLDLESAGAGREHLTLTGPGPKLEALEAGGGTYFRGRDFLAAHLGSDVVSQSLLAVSGGAWWRGLAGIAPPALPDFTSGKDFTLTFLGSVVTSRSDHAAVDGRPAVELSGPRADVYISSRPPYVLLRVAEHPGVAVDGLRQADFEYSNFGRDFDIAPPGDVIDFSDLSSLPPIYTVVSVDASGCSQPCVVAAVVRNLGGTRGAKSASSVVFTATAAAGDGVLGRCTATIAPDVGYNATTRVSCTIALAGGADSNAALVTADPVNPGHA